MRFLPASWLARPRIGSGSSKAVVGADHEVFFTVLTRSKFFQGFNGTSSSGKLRFGSLTTNTQATPPKSLEDNKLRISLQLAFELNTLVNLVWFVVVVAVLYWFVSTR